MAAVWLRPIERREQDKIIASDSTKLHCWRDIFIDVATVIATPFPLGIIDQIWSFYATLTTISKARAPLFPAMIDHPNVTSG